MKWNERQCFIDEARYHPVHTYNSCVIWTLPESSSRSPSPVSGVKPVPTAASDTNTSTTNQRPFPSHTMPSRMGQSKTKKNARPGYRNTKAGGTEKNSHVLFLHTHSLFTRVRYVPLGIRTRCRLPPLAGRATILTRRRSPSEACPAGGGAGAAMLASRRTWRGTSARIPSIASPPLSV